MSTELQWEPCMPPYERYLVSDVGLFKNGDTGALKAIFYDTRGKPRVSVFAEGQRWSTAKYFHIMMWEAFYGPIPKNHFVVPVDGIWAHLELSNWELVSIQEYRQRQWEDKRTQEDAIFNETLSELDEWIFGDCVESEEERRSRLKW